MSMKLDGRWFESARYLHVPSALPRLGRRARDPIHGSARLCTSSELKALTAAPPPERRGISFPGASVIVDDPVSARGCRPYYSVDLHLPEEQALRHILAVGQCGSGKSTRFILPACRAALEHPEASVVILCAKADQLRAIHGLAKRSGKRVRVLNLSNPARSAAWNAAEHISSEAEAIRLAHTLCHSLPKSNREETPFWIENSIQIIAGILEAEARSGRGAPTLPRVREVLSLPADKFIAYCEEHANVRSLANFRQFLRSGSQNADTILCDTRMRVRVYDDQDLAAVTSRHELDFDELFGRKPTVFIVEMDETRISMHRPTWNLFLGGLIDRAVEVADRRPGGRLERPLYIMIDEFASSVGRIPDFEIRLNTLRSRRVGVVAAVQSLTQLKLVYGEGADPVLAGFSTKVFLAGLERADAEFASAQAGTTTVVARARRYTRDANRELRSITTEAVNTGRRLLTPEDIATPPEHFELGGYATCFLPGARPLLVWLRPSYRLPELIDAEREFMHGLPADRSRRNGPLLNHRAQSWGQTHHPTSPISPLEVVVQSFVERREVSFDVSHFDRRHLARSAEDWRAARAFARERLDVAGSGIRGQSRWRSFCRYARRQEPTSLKFLSVLLSLRTQWTDVVKAWLAEPSKDWLEILTDLRGRQKSGDALRACVYDGDPELSEAADLMEIPGLTIQTRTVNGETQQELLVDEAANTEAAWMDALMAQQEKKSKSLIWSSVHKRKLQDVDWQGASPDAKRFWRGYEARFDSEPMRILEIIERLARHNATIEDLYMIATSSSAQSIESYLDELE